MTRTLFWLGLLLLVGVVAAALVDRPQHRAAAPSATTAPATKPAPATRPTALSPAATTAAPATTGLATSPSGGPIRDVHAVATTPFSITITWRTASPARGRVAVGAAGEQPTLWSPLDGPGTVHRAEVDGVALDASYRLRIHSTAANGASASAVADVRTPRPQPSLVAAIGGGAVRLGGAPFFPLMVWGQCPDAYSSLLAAGIDLLAENPCGGTGPQVDALAGRALSAGIAGDADWQNPALVGWFYPDEADARRITASTLPKLPPSRVVGRISFLTLSNHFYSQAAPLAFGRGVYPGLVARADVVGFDLYPLQNWCQANRFDDVYRAQSELVRLARGKPTFQWIETGPMGCDGPGTTVTPATVRAESWLAVVGGAHGLGFFPGTWAPAVGAAVAQVGRDVKAIAPALLRPPVAATASPPLRIAAWSSNGADYVVAVNPTRRPVASTLRVPSAGDRLLRPLDGGPPLHARDGVATATFAPLDAHVYVAAPRR